MTVPVWLRRAAGMLGPFLALIVLLVAFRLAAGASFWGWFNLQNILTQTVLVAVGAVGMTVIIVAGGIDLSCGAVLALAAVMSDSSSSSGESKGETKSESKAETKSESKPSESKPAAKSKGKQE